MDTEYERAVMAHGQKVYAFARYSLRGGQDADDVTQEVLIKLWRHWNSVDPGKIQAWLMRVARNAVVDQIRKRQLTDSRIDDRIEAETRAKEENQGEERDREHLRAALLNSIQALDEPFRSLLILRDIQGLSYADIEGAMELSESQVKVYLHRGRKKLREDGNLRALFHNIHGTGENGKEVCAGEAADNLIKLGRSGGG